MSPLFELDKLRDREEFEAILERFAEKIAEKISVPLPPERIERPIVERLPEITLKPKAYPYFTYPRDPKSDEEYRKEIPKGITLLDFWDGTVELGDGTDDRISDKLEAYPDEEFIRSFQIDTSKDIVIWLDEYGRKPIDLDDIHLETHQNFRRLYIKADEATKIAVWASTNPRAHVRTLKPTIFRGTINEYNTIVNPLSEFGNAITKLGYYSGSDTSYQTLASWNITAGYYGVLNEISFTSVGAARYKLTIAGVQQFIDMKVVAPPALPVPVNKIAAAQTILLEVKSTGAAIEVNGSITGKEVIVS